MNIKQYIKKYIPPVFLEWKNKQSNMYGYFGDYKNWEEAKNDSSGYASDSIVEKVRVAALKVKNGDAKYERDSVIFDTIDMSWPLLAGLLWVAGKYDNHLRVVDFGGSLGTTYQQNKKFLNHLKELTWHIVEQDKFVAIGKEEFTNEILDFWKDEDLEKLVNQKKPNVLILSSSLQFLEKPFEFLEKISKLDIPYVIFDKIPFFTEPDLSTRLMVQKVSPKIYGASYPVWIFGQTVFLLSMSRDFELITNFNAYNGHIENIQSGHMHYLGFIFKKK
jgi:putative methyltransferase (TIGR04325 family)